MKKIEYHPHVADVRLRVESDSLEELFEAALKGMGNFMKKDFCYQHAVFDKRLPIQVQSRDVTTLLIDFLSEVLTRSHLEKTVFCELEVSQLSETKILATVFGRPVTEFDEDIKAVTYHEAEVRKNASDNWETFIIFDI